MFDVGLTGLELAIGAGVVVIAAALQGSIGFGLAVLSVPILTVVDPVFTPIPILILSLLVGAGTLIRERGDLDLEGLGWVISGRVPGALAGAWVLSIATERALGIVIGVIVLLAVAVLGSGWSVRLTRSSRVVAGLISGFSGTSSGIGGPPIALLYGRQAGPVVRSTLGAIFTIGITINLLILTAVGILTSRDIGVAVLLSPAMILGFLISGRLRPHVDGERVRIGILVVSSVAAVGLLVRSIAG
jgi:uncharacterized membrane protein YfcA